MAAPPDDDGEVRNPKHLASASTRFIQSRYRSGSSCLHSNVRCDVVAFDGRRATRAPETLEVQVVGRLPTDVHLADMVIEELS